MCIVFLSDSETAYAKVRYETSIAKERTMARPRTPSPPIHLVSARMLDLDKGELVEPGSLLIDGERIVEVWPTSVPDEAHVLEVGDLTLLPGLTDMEVNLLLGGPDHTSALTAEAGPDGVEVLEFRIATSFDMKIFDRTVEQWKPIVAAAEANYETWMAMQS
jgi:imidazolonepropionase-like amidohydrolase